MPIIKLQRDAIDDIKWDKCVRQAFNGVVYAHTWYLDIVCDEWEAMVLNDYEAVVPLPIKRQSFINYVVLPYWIPHLGIINQKPINEEDSLELLKQVPYLNISLTLNAHNKLPEKTVKQLKQIRYYVLDLILSLEKLKRRFLPEMAKSQSMYDTKKVTVVRSLNAKEYCDFVRLHTEMSEDNVKQLTKLISFALRYKTAGAYAAYNERNDLIAQAFFVKSNGSLSLLNYAAVAEDVKLHGPKAIIYHILKHNAESNLTMEFPYFSNQLGRYFTQTEHVCLKYHKGWMYYMD